MEKREFYHLFSEGFRTESLFDDRKAFIAGMNIIAVCWLKCDVKILAFCLMDNHVHFILYGTLTECNRFIEKFIHRYGIWFHYRYGHHKYESLKFDIKSLNDERYLLTSIAYALRNGIAAGYCFCAEDYPWSSAGLYFRMPERMSSMTQGWKKVSEIPVRKLRSMVLTRTELPKDWKVTPEGYIWPGNYVDYSTVEKLYRTPKSFTFFMGQGKEDDINRSLGIHNAIALPDMELKEKTVEMCFKLFKTSNLRGIDVQKRILLAKELRKKYCCSIKQIARTIHLDTIYLKDLT